MPVFLFLLLSAFIPPSHARTASLAFEQRMPALFETQFGHNTVRIQPDRVSLGSLTLRFAGASPDSRIEGVGSAAPSTYFASAFNQTFRQFPKIRLRHLYPGVDAVFYGDYEHLEYDLVLSPGASRRSSLRRLRLSFEGAQRLYIDRTGDLVVQTASGVLIQKLPHVFQSDGKPVSARYVLFSPAVAGLRLGRHDSRLPLTIDPELVYANSFGGSGSDNASLIATDSQGNIYIAGSTNSIDFPTTLSSPIRITPPMATFSGGSASSFVTVGVETSVLALGGTPDGSILYAATPGGMYETADGGATWQRRGQLPATINAGTPFPFGAAIANIAVDPVDPSRVFIATNRGLFFSADSGQTWALRVFGLFASGDGTVSTSAVIISPIDHRIMYAVTDRPFGLFKSTDAGNNWRELNPSYQREPQFLGGQLMIALAPNGNDLYVLDTNANLLSSTDGGVTWTPLAQALYYVRKLIVDSRGNILVLIAGYGIEESVDGGMTFSPLAVPQASPLQHLAVDPSGVLYAGTLSSVVASKDGGSTWQVLAATPNLRALAAFGQQIYAGFDTIPVSYISKWDPSGTHLLYSTFIAAANSQLTELKVDAQGNCVLFGSTYSPGFPATSKIGPPGITAIFVTKLNADGTQMIYSTLLSGSKGAFAGGLALDSSGAAYIIGQTRSSDFPTTANVIQPALPTATCTRPQSGFFVMPNLGTHAFVSKLSPDGTSLAFSTFLSASCGSVGLSITVDPAGEPIIGGYTTSPDFPVSANAYQSAFPGDPQKSSPPNPLYAGFVTRLSANADAVLASSYLGGGYYSQVNALALDAAGNVVMTGLTSSIATGATPGAFQTQVIDRCSPVIGIGPSPPYAGTYDAFVLKLDPALASARFLTYLGGGCEDSGNGIALDAGGNIWVNGTSISPDFPLLAPYQGPGIAGRFVSELSADGSQLLFSSGTNGSSLALDPAGAVYLAGSQPNTIVPAHAELIKIDPGAAPDIIINRITPVTNFPAVSLNRSLLGPAIVPGELIRITGHNLGPAAKINGQLDDSGRLPFTLGNSRVLIGGISAALLSVEDNEIECFVPFETLRPAEVIVESNGQKSNSVRTGVVTYDPQILSIANQDGTVNSADHPAPIGSIVTIYASGFGQTDPPSGDGLVNAGPLRVPLAPVIIYVGGNQVKPQFIGGAPGMIAGIVQINLALPAGDYSMGKTFVLLNGAAATIYVGQ